MHTGQGKLLAIHTQLLPINSRSCCITTLVTKTPVFNGPNLLPANQQLIFRAAILLNSYAAAVRYRRAII